MLEPLERFFRRVGCLILLDRAADPAANGHVQRNGTHIKVFSGGAVRSLSDVHAQLHATSHQPGGGDAMAVDAAAATGSLRTLGTTALKAAAGDHTHAAGSVDISVRAYNSANLSIADTTWTTITLDSERFDTDTMHSTVTNTGRLTATTAGKYVITGHGWFTFGNTIGYRGARILLNGATVIDQMIILATAFSSATNAPFRVSTIYSLAATDYVELQVIQTSGGALNVEAALNWSPEFAMMKVLG